MPIQPSDLLRLAQQLGQNTNDEVSIRSAVSRAYYAGLHAAEQTFPSRERMGNESSHAEIISRATIHGKGLNPGRGSAAQIAIKLGKLRRLRNDADYAIGVPSITAQDCETVLLRSQEILDLCQDVQTKVGEAQT